MKEPLCFCEYINVKGERSHMIATCCDCEAVDAGCDRCCRGQGIPDENYENILHLISDRVRLPWCSGYGAKQCDWELVGPVICVLLMLSIGSLHPILTVLCIGALGFCIMKHHRVWNRKNIKPKTKVFYVFGVCSAWIMLLTFLVVIMPLGKVNLLQFLLFVTSFSLMMYALVYAKKDPGFLRTSSAESQITSSGQTSVTHTANASSIKDSVYIEDSGGKLTVMSEDLVSNKQQSIPLKDVTWVDSRPIKDDTLIVWCDKCAHSIPPRGAHCPVCGICVAVRDHHCVWIDQCIGGRNHRSFILLMVFWVVSGLYGSHLALASLCNSSEMLLFHWSQVPTDCSGVYNQYSSAWAFVGVFYTILCCLLISAVLFNQIILVAQDLTSQELHNALKLGWVRYLCFANFNKNNKGIIRNLVSFFTNKRLHINESNLLVV